MPLPYGLLEACRLLSLQPPEIRITRLDGRPIDTEGEYRTSAHFKGDPFLTRAGAIGSTKGRRASKAAAKESCAAEVVRYLIKMVNEDTELEEEESAKREQPKHWQENTLRMYASQGFVGCWWGYVMCMYGHDGCWSGYYWNFWSLSMLKTAIVNWSMY